MISGGLSRLNDRITAPHQRPPWNFPAFRSYALSRNMWSMLPIDGSKSCQISESRRSMSLISSAYYCRPCGLYLEGGQYAHDLLHPGTDTSDVRCESGRTVSRGL